MLRDGGIEVAPTWAQEDGTATSYREIDKQLRRIAKRRAALDVEEAKWLREAERQRIWRKLGFSTALEYLEDVFGHTPRTAMERLRVAKELGVLPGLEAALACGALPWSAARELSRVMTPDTEARWLERARGKNVADVALMVSGHKKGDDPDEPKDPALMTRKLVLELPPALDALFEKTRLVLEQERGEHLDDVVVFEAMCMRCLDPVPSLVEGKVPKPMNRIISFRCEDCFRAWREGRGRLVPIAPADLELAACDAELVRELGPAVLATEDDPTTDDPIGDNASARSGAAGRHVTHIPRTKDGKVQTKRRPPPTLTIPKATRDFVWARDQGRCRVPGCRATRHLACHHVWFRAQGGDHDPVTIILICDGHHKLLHQGLLTVTGRAPDKLIFIRDGKRLVDARSTTEASAAETLRADANRTHDAKSSGACMTKRSRFDDVVTFEQAKQALMQLGYKARAARAALDGACAQVGGDADVAMLVKAVLARQRANPDRSCLIADDDVRGDATKALAQLGYSRAVAAAAVEAASAHVGARAELTTLIKEALRRCGSR
jgi:Holliday junction resolvasome RuvABC DNA-binding subunit